MLRPADAIRLDLHAHTASEALEAFREAYNRQVNLRSSRPLEIVHGYGSSGEGGIIRSRLRAFLQSHSQRLVFRPGELIDGNPGYTLVYPKAPLPSQAENLNDEIEAFCATPRSEEKIAGKFRRYGDVAIRTALRELERQDRITSVYKGKFKHYVSVSVK